MGSSLAPVLHCPGAMKRTTNSPKRITKTLNRNQLRCVQGGEEEIWIIADIGTEFHQSNRDDREKSSTR